MAKPREFFYYRLIPGEMELRLKGISRDAELIVHRLMRVYFSREREIPATPAKIASLTGFTEDEVRDAWEDLAEVVDIGGSEVRIPWFDAEVERAMARAEQARKNAAKRWGGGEKC